jgi:hypothetical protein
MIRGCSVKSYRAHWLAHYPILPRCPSIIVISMFPFFAKAVSGGVACVPVCGTTIPQTLHVEAIWQLLAGFRAT